MNASLRPQFHRTLCPYVCGTYTQARRAAYPRGPVSLSLKRGMEVLASRSLPPTSEYQEISLDVSASRGAILTVTIEASQPMDGVVIDDVVVD